MIKNSVQKHDSAWSLQSIKPKTDGGAEYESCFDYKTGQNKTILMLQAMFHVSQPSRNYKNWLYAVLRWLFEQRIHAITAADFEQFLNKLSDKFYFGRYGYGKNPVDFLDLILDTQEISTESLDLHNADSDFWKQGTHTPHFVFNRLEYALWKHGKENDAFKISSETRQKFYFAFRNSVEHFHPQDLYTLDKKLSEQEKQEKEKWLHRFGNLCLLNHSDNSKFSNWDPYYKTQKLKESGRIPSLKLEVMMNNLNNQKWEEAEVKEHGNAMINLLNRPFHPAR